MKKSLLRIIAITVLSFAYGASSLLSKIAGRRGKKGWKPSNKILVIGTFHNPNWFHSHIGPLSKSGVGEIVLVCDEPVDSLENVLYACPPKILAKLLSRAVAKFIWAIACSFKHKPDLYMGYHIFPGAISALFVARIFNRPACYQCTAGALEIAGGGWHGENRIHVALGKSSRYVERLALAAVREFDLVVVRGEGAKSYFLGHGFTRELAIITGSVKHLERWLTFSERPIDIVFVGRLTEYKRPDRFVKIIAQIAKEFPQLQAVALGEGPDKEKLIKQATELRVANNIKFLGKRKDVPNILIKSKIFILTSRWEGLSIAMLEAMAAGAVPVVSNVGDLGDIIKNNVNGYIHEEKSLELFSASINDLLKNEKKWLKLSKRAATDSIENSGIEVIASRWHHYLNKLIKNK